MEEITEPSASPEAATPTPNNNQASNSNNKNLTIHEILADADLTFSPNGLPEKVLTKAAGPAITKNAKSEVWSFYLALCQPIEKSEPEESPSKRQKITLNIKAFAVSPPYTHICRLCLEEVQNMADDKRDDKSWTKALCRINNTSGGNSHISTKHNKHASVIEFQQKKKDAKNSKGALHSSPSANTSGSTSSGRASTLNAAFTKQTQERARLLQTAWVVMNNIPYNVLQAPEFRLFMQLYDPQFAPIAQSTFDKLRNDMFDSMNKDIKQLLIGNANQFGGLEHLSLVHDMWTTSTNKGALGSSFKIIDKDFVPYVIAATLKELSTSHAAEDVAEALKQEFKDRFGVDLVGVTKYVASDTTPSAANVSKNLESEQNNCEMHVISLILGYGLGYKEYTKTVSTTDENGAKTKTKTVVTPGGEFSDGMRIIKAARKIVNFFGASPQRNEKLDTCRNLFALPMIQLKADAETRAAFIISMFQSVLANHFLLQSTSDSFGEFTQVWNALTSDDVKAMQEMEAVCESLSKYAMCEAQTASKHDSHLILLYRMLLRDSLYKDEYRVIDLGRPGPTQTMKGFPRKERKVEEFTDTAKKCIERLKSQMNKRLSAPTPQNCVSALLDPTTLHYAKGFMDTESDTLYQETVNHLRVEHRSVFRVIYGKGADTADSSGEGSNNDTNNDNDLVTEELDEPREMSEEEDEDDMFCMTMPNAPTKTPEDDLEVMNKAADDVLKKWLNDKPDYDKFLFEKVDDIIWKKKRNSETKTVSIFELISKFDTMKYFRESGTKDYPTISMLARIYFSRLDNAAFQERVFSTAANAQSKNQGKMSFDHLEQRVLLQQNRDLIRAGKLCKEFKLYKQTNLKKD